MLNRYFLERTAKMSWSPSFSTVSVYEVIGRLLRFNFPGLKRGPAWKSFAESPVFQNTANSFAKNQLLAFGFQNEVG